ncbi:MAG: ribose 5-phosphate isomerase B [Bacillota bacterium]|nr:ribose 5-phosphate isomerase B [Bacillota bacterium]
MIAIGADHGAFALKEVLRAYLEKEGYEVFDAGTYSSDSVDYPVFAHQVTDAVVSGKCDKGILLCGTGIGMSIAANKVHGIRAALCSEPLSARLTREHNDSNVLCMGARMIGEEMAKEIVKVWLETKFSDDARHIRRIVMLEDQSE